jgi:hypothetical protein
MLIIDNHFDEYITKNENISLHPNKSYDYFPKNIADLKNIIFYGPNGVGKYTQMLAAIKQYSPSKLKYEKRITITFNKNNYIFKISDIHFEIDMSLLGCNAKLLWNEIYTNIIDIILARTDNKIGIIVCKNFNEIHSELLEIFYIYIQKTITSIDIKFILLMNNIGFLPNNIYNNCKLIRVPRPSKKSYGRITKNKLLQDIMLEDITNIKNFSLDINFFNQNKPICDVIINSMLNIKELKYNSFRNEIYNIFIYNLNIVECFWYILNKLIQEDHIKDKYVGEIYIELIKFLQYYNNNYRPIYHLENYLLYLITKIHEI